MIYEKEYMMDRYVFRSSNRDGNSFGDGKEYGDGWGDGSGDGCDDNPFFNKYQFVDLKDVLVYISDRDKLRILLRGNR